MKQLAVAMVLLGLAASLSAEDGHSKASPAYLGIPHDKSSSHIQAIPEDTRKLIAQHGKIHPVTPVTEKQFWKDVKENRALHIRVIGGQLFYSVKAAAHLASQDGMPAPWVSILGRCRVERKEKAQQGPRE